MKNREGFEIYVHIPFCVRKCDYCDFVSFVASKECQRKYFDALKRQIELKREIMGQVPVVSCFFGGGTPSLPDEELIEEVLFLLKESFSFSEDAEITIEVNPNSGAKEKLIRYRQAGFNRLSIGLQSCNEKELKVLSRVHSYEDFLCTYQDAREAGFDNINIDLMSALPGQTLASYEESLRKVIELKPEHISAYSLIIEEGTPFFERYKDLQGLPSEDEEREMYYLTESVLNSAGYYRYEISNYAKPGYECRHNVGYWRRVPYIGFGIAAASLYKEKRYMMHTNLEDFIEGKFTEEETLLTREEQMEEFVFLGLRCTDGISKAEFKETFGVDIEEVYKKELCKLINEGLLVCAERIFLTKKGLDVANYCMSEFIR